MILESCLEQKATEPKPCSNCGKPIWFNKDDISYINLHTLKCDNCGFKLSDKSLDKLITKWNSKPFKKLKSQTISWTSSFEQLPTLETQVLLIINDIIAIGALFREPADWESGQSAYLYWDDPNGGEMWEWNDVTHWAYVKYPEFKKI